MQHVCVCVLHVRVLIKLRSRMDSTNIACTSIAEHSTKTKFGQYTLTPWFKTIIFSHAHIHTNLSTRHASDCITAPWWRAATLCSHRPSWWSWTWWPLNHLPKSLTWHKEVKPFKAESSGQNGAIHWQSLSDRQQHVTSSWVSKWKMAKWHLQCVGSDDKKKNVLLHTKTYFQNNKDFWILQYDIAVTMINVNISSSIQRQISCVHIWVLHCCILFCHSHEQVVSRTASGPCLVDCRWSGCLMGPIRPGFQSFCEKLHIVKQIFGCKTQTYLDMACNVPQNCTACQSNSDYRIWKISLFGTTFEDYFWIHFQKSEPFLFLYMNQTPSLQTSSQLLTGKPSHGTPVRSCPTIWFAIGARILVVVWLSK